MLLGTLPIPSKVLESKMTCLSKGTSGGLRGFEPLRHAKICLELIFQAIVLVDNNDRILIFKTAAPWMNRIPFFLNCRVMIFRSSLMTV